ncbi:MAG: hypothetical protein KDJ77_19280 [Rhodobiaceae bacterium]|nr:hypothetical protein [Rhodobiaceae bacterium]
MEILPYVIWLVIAVAVIFVLRKSLGTVQEGRLGVVTRFGRLKPNGNNLRPGPVILIPFVDQLHEIFIGEDGRRFVEVIEVKEKKGKKVLLDMVPHFHVTDASKAMFGFRSLRRTLRNLLSKAAVMAVNDLPPAEVEWPDQIKLSRAILEALGKLEEESGVPLPIKVDTLIVRQYTYDPVEAEIKQARDKLKNRKGIEVGEAVSKDTED